DPSVEAVLHALIPFTYVDHTHADAVVALTNSPNGRELVDRVYGDTVMVVPYIMPGFPLARAVFERSREVDWSKLEGMILLNHGIFTWGNTARESYERMIRLVGKAEEYLASRGAMRSVRTAPAGAEDLVALARIRRAVSDLMGQPMVAKLTSTDASRGFASLANVASIATRGPLTPDHVIRTKPIPVVLRNDPPTDVREFGAAYRHYFERNADETKRMLTSRRAG